MLRYLAFEIFAHYGFWRRRKHGEIFVEDELFKILVATSCRASLGLAAASGATDA